MIKRGSVIGGAFDTDEFRKGVGKRRGQVIHIDKRGDCRGRSGGVNPEGAGDSFGWTFSCFTLIGDGINFISVAAVGEFDWIIGITVIVRDREIKLRFGAGDSMDSQIITVIYIRVFTRISG